MLVKIMRINYNDDMEIDDKEKLYSKISNYFTIINIDMRRLLLCVK